VNDDDISRRLALVRSRMAGAAARADRPPDTVRLVAISKTWPAESVRAAAATGQIDFGENRVQEALQKIDATAGLPLRWHLVGHLQSNKARKAAAAFHLIHSIDGPDLLRAVDRAAADAGTSPGVLLQVDLAREPTKHGAALDSLRPLVETALACRAVRLQGLMLLPPFLEDPEEVRPYFRRLRELRNELVSRGVDPGAVGELSMGMSHDFEVAIEEGATIVRVGTAIFGTRLSGGH
jgi:pyridoxal phosphate enzyme (YggS family)